MAGKNIYIEKILDNLLGGIDAAIAQMKNAIYTMIGGDDPENQKTLVDVTDKLNDVIGEDQKSLSDLVVKLDDVVNAISYTVTNPYFKEGDIYNVPITKRLYDFVEDTQPPTATYPFTTYFNGECKLNLHFKCKAYNNAIWDQSWTFNLLDENDVLIKNIKTFTYPTRVETLIDEDFSVIIQNATMLGKFKIQFVNEGQYLYIYPKGTDNYFSAVSMEYDIFAPATEGAIIFEE